jgi:hypothetical protein
MNGFQRITAPQLRPGKADLVSPKHLGPVPVIEVISSHAYRVKLPKGLNCHDVFPVQYLKPYYSRDEGEGENDEEVPDYSEDIVEDGGENDEEVPDEIDAEDDESMSRLEESDE